MEHTRKSQVVQNAQLKIFTHLLICCTQPISLVNSNYFVSLSWIKSPFLTVDTSSSSQDDEIFTLKIKTNATDLRFHSKPKISSCIFPDFPRTEGFFFFLLFGIFPSSLIRAREWKTDFPTRIFHGQLHENAKWTPIKRRSVLENINSFSVVGARWISTNFYSFSLFLAHFFPSVSCKLTHTFLSNGFYPLLSRYITEKLTQFSLHVAEPQLWCNVQWKEARKFYDFPIIG